MGYHTVVAGQTITAANHNTHIRDQVVVPFATTSARTSAITSPGQGMLSYRNDLGSGGGFEHYNGTSWVPAGAQLISGQTLSGAAGTITFSSIPAVYSSLLVLGLGTVTGTGTSVDCTLAINGDNGSNYSYASEDASQASLNYTGAFANAATTMNWAIALPGSSYNTDRVGGFAMTIPGYSNTTHKKITLADMWMSDNGSSMNLKKRYGYWKSTSAISGLVFTSGSGNFSAGTHFALYGLP